MSYKKIKIISIIIMFVLAFPFHFVYDIFPNSITSIFFPVNESIWEHMKLLSTTVLVSNFIIYFLLKKYKLPFNNFIFASLFSAVFIVPLYLVIFLPIYYTFGHNLIVSLSIMLLTFIIIAIINFIIIKKEKIKYLDSLSSIGIIILYIIYGYLTYNPFKTDLFYDHIKDKYGINIYVLGNSKVSY